MAKKPPPMPSERENRKRLFLQACRCEPTDRVPVWIMRQAGRYLPEYQAVRAKHSFLEICKTPALATEVSIQPFQALGVDAVIVFSDILIVAEAMGMPLDVPDSGPILSDPLRDERGVRRLRGFDPEAETRFVGDAIRQICRAVGPDVPVIGFAAAPWTLACYMIEGRARGDVAHAKSMLELQPKLLRDLLGKIAHSTARYLRAQIDAGACAVQLFDTWAGELSEEQYGSFELDPTQMIFQSIENAGIAKILFARGSSRHLRSLARTGAGVLSVDSNTDLGAARRELGNRIALQGNVNPEILMGSEADAARAALAAVEKTGGFGHVLNLGHGILPSTPVSSAKAFVASGKTAPIAQRAQLSRAD